MWANESLNYLFPLPIAFLMATPSTYPSSTPSIEVVFSICSSFPLSFSPPNQSLAKPSRFFSKLKKKWGEKRSMPIWHQTPTCKVTFLFAYLDTLESGKSVFTLILGNMYLFCFVWKWVFRMLTRVYIFNLSVFVLYGLGEN